MNNSLKVVIAVLGIMLVFLLGAVFEIAQTVLVPLIIAALLYFVLAPAVNFLERIHIPRIISIVIVILMLLGIFYLVGLFLYTSVQSVVRAFPKYQVRIDRIISDISSSVLQKYDVSQVLFAGINWTTTLRNYLLSWSGSFIKFMTSAGIILVFLIFLLLERPYFKSKLTNAFVGQTRQKIESVFDHINRQIGRYLVVKLFISGLTGVLVWLSLTVLGVDFPLLWGLLAVLLNFIPNLGSLVIVVFTTVMAIVQFYPEYGRPLLTFAVMLAIQLIMGNFVDPRLSGDRLNLSPLVILLSLVFWGWLWGIVGMFLSVPITVVIKIICENVPSLRPVSVFMGSGKWREV